jgi:PIN domain nuclease of toxin-antitoxin system
VNEAVLDSSVLIAIFRNENIDVGILDVIEGAVISAANYSEVWAKLFDFGLTSDPRIDAVLNLLSRIAPFTESQARLAADLRPLTKYAGLSLGDRACLALALEIGAEVYTADRQWAHLKLGCSIHLIR